MAWLKSVKRTVLEMIETGPKSERRVWSSDQPSVRAVSSTKDVTQRLGLFFSSSELGGASESNRWVCGLVENHRDQSWIFCSNEMENYFLIKISWLIEQNRLGVDMEVKEHYFEFPPLFSKIFIPATELSRVNFSWFLTRLGWHGSGQHTVTSLR